MFCSKCGWEITEGRFCPKCGTPCEIASEPLNLNKEQVNNVTYTTNVPVGEPTNTRSKTGKTIGGAVILCLAIIALILLVCFGIGSDKVISLFRAQDKHVLFVKDGHPNSYPDKTYGEAFENFFSSPTWRYFKGTQNGPDEDGDGKPDYTNDNIDVVEFTGNCTYSGVEVKALIQFTLDLDNNSLEATYLSLNDVPQNLLVLYSLIGTVFENDTTIANTENNTTSIDDINETIDENDVTTPEENESDTLNQSGNDIESIDFNYEGEYLSVNGNMDLYLDLYENVDSDGSIGNVFVYEGENLIHDTPYYVADTVPDYFDGTYERIYVFYDQGNAYYLGISILDGNEIRIDYNSEYRNIDCFKKYEEGSTNSYDNEFILPNSQTEYITDYDLLGLTKDQCRIARNEIYARHGKIFKSQELVDYFYSTSWYIPNEGFDDSELSQLEKDNINTIVAYEERMGYK